jgi:hypothetical protein
MFLDAMSDWGGPQLELQRAAGVKAERSIIQRCRRRSDGTYKPSERMAAHALERRYDEGSIANKPCPTTGIGENPTDSAAGESSDFCAEFPEPACFFGSGTGMFYGISGQSLPTRNREVDRSLPIRCFRTLSFDNDGRRITE